MKRQYTAPALRIAPVSLERNLLGSYDDYTDHGSIIDYYDDEEK